MSDYPLAQWFDPPRPCRVCGKPGGELRGYGNNATLAFMCERHAKQAIAAAHRRGHWEPDAVADYRRMAADEVSP